MTIGEVTRAVESNNRLVKLEAKERATFDYIQATLIVKGFAIAFGAKESYPTIQQAYSGVFDDEIKAKEQEIQDRKDTLSALRFKQFAQSYNDKLKHKEVLKGT